MLLTDRAKAFVELGKLYQESQNFSESIPVTDPEILGEVRSLLDEEVGGVIQRVFDLTIDSNTNTFRGKAEQKLSLAKSQFYQFSMSPSAWDYKLIPAQSVNPEMAEFDENNDEDWAGAIEFAATAVKSKSARASKKLNCKPGNTQCGGKCQDGKKNCRYAPSHEQSQAVETVATKAKTKAKKTTTSPSEATSDTPTTKGGSISPIAGKLTKTESKSSDSESKSSTPKSEQEKIDQKYASDNPSNADIDGWIKDQLAYNTSAEGLTLRSKLERRYKPSGSQYWEDAPDEVRRAMGDKNAYLNQVAKELHEDNVKKNADGIDYGDWQRYAFITDATIEATKAKIANPKTKPTVKAKLEKQLKQQETEKESAQATAKRLTDRLKLSQDELRKRVEEEFDADQAKQEATAKKIQTRIAKGDQKTIQEQLESVLGFKAEYAPPPDREVPAATENRQRELIKRHLQGALHPSASRDVLGVSKDATPAQIKTAYRKASLQAHPDVGGSSQEFERINNAYNKLKKELNFSEISDEWWYSFEALDFADLANEEFLGV
jgi:hypothetical protein